MNKVPMWARKPKHNKEVVATDKGWIVKETGELLVSVRNLDQRLKAVNSTPTVLPEPEGVIHPEQIIQEEVPVIVVEPTIVVEDDANNEPVIELDVKPVEETTPVIVAEAAPKEEFSEEVKQEQVKKKPGRPKKVKPE